MELYELEIHQLRSGPEAHGQPVTGCHHRVRCFPVQPPGSTGCEDRLACPDGLEVTSLVGRARSEAAAIALAQVDRAGAGAAAAAPAAEIPVKVIGASINEMQANARIDSCMN